MAEFDHKSGKIPPKAEGLACMQSRLLLQHTITAITALYFAAFDHINSKEQQLSVDEQSYKQ